MNEKEKEAFEKHLDEMIGSSTTRRKFYGGEGSGTVAATRTAWQAACEYKQEEIETVINENTHYFESLTKCEDKLEKLQAENKKLREALKFYADRNNWKFHSYSGDCKDVIDFNDLDCRSYTVEADFACSSGGRRAREALKEVGEE